VCRAGSSATAELLVPKVILDYFAAAIIGLNDNILTANFNPWIGSSVYRDSGIPELLPLLNPIGQSASTTETRCRPNET